MNEQSFVSKRGTDWDRLTALCNKADGGLRKLSSGELLELVRLYRRASTDLAVARTKSTNVPLIASLNDLVGRAYGILYRSPKQSFWGGLMKAAATSAQTVRRNKWFVLTSATIFFGSAFFIFGLMSWMPGIKDQIIPPAMDKLFDSWRSGKFEEHSGSESSMMAGFYASNNPRTSIITGAVGAGSFGVVSVYLLFNNGAILGALAHEMNKVGKLGFLISSIAPHGVTELSGIIVAGSCGLLLGYAVINPGRRRRSDSLRAVGRDAVVLLATSVVLMFIAAPIEAFFSFQPAVPQWLKAAVAIIGLFVWMVFWTSFGREPEPLPVAR
ncbi:MAG: stage II sporulation protein M [Fimbriimonas sp.]|nr:stage II sporulation protein M [Fimbriimonas sp.]